MDCLNYLCKLSLGSSLYALSNTNRVKKKEYITWYGIADNTVLITGCEPIIQTLIFLLLVSFGIIIIQDKCTTGKSCTPATATIAQRACLCMDQKTVLIINISMGPPPTNYITRSWNSKKSDKNIPVKSLRLVRLHTWHFKSHLASSASIDQSELRSWYVQRNLALEFSSSKYETRARISSNTDGS